jgi:hypothetical protein
MGREEKENGLWTSTGVPVIAAITGSLTTIMYGAYSVQKSAEAAFATKVVELALSGASSGPEAIGRAKVAVALFPDLLPADFVGRLERLNHYGNAEAVRKMELLELLAQAPANRGSVVTSATQRPASMSRFPERLTRTADKPRHGPGRCGLVWRRLFQPIGDGRCVPFENRCCR